jgi:hypothetical protein
MDPLVQLDGIVDSGLETRLRTVVDTIIRRTPEDSVIRIPSEGSTITRVVVSDEAAGDRLVVNRVDHPGGGRGYRVVLDEGGDPNIPDDEELPAKAALGADPEVGMSFVSLVEAITTPDQLLDRAQAITGT